MAANSQTPNPLVTGESQTAATMGLDELSPPTQGVSQRQSVETGCKVWGRLFPLNPLFGDSPFPMIDDAVTVGRGDDCTIVLKKTKSTPDGHVVDKFYKAYSKVHFKLTRNRTTTGSFTFIEDCSSNGTFVNRSKVGKGSRQFLSNNDEIAICQEKNRLFVYMEIVEEAENVQMPPEISSGFTMGKVLGTGAYGEVRLAFENGTCRRVAVKIVSKERLWAAAEQRESQKVESRFKGLTPELQTKREIEILRRVSHPCVVGIELVADSPLAFYLVLELAEGGDLHTRLKNNRGPLGERLAKIFFLQIASAVHYLHQNRVTHRDLKPENILLMTGQRETRAKVTDFGLAKLATTMSSMTTFCGTPLFVAPEVIRAQGNASYTSAVDLWSLGVLLYFCLASELPFHDGRADMPLSQQILNANFSFPTSRWSSISSTAQTLVSEFLRVDPRRRITAGAALQNAAWLDDSVAKDAVDALIYGPRCQTPEPTFLTVPRGERCRTPTVRQSDNDENANVTNEVLVDRPADELVAASNYLKRPIRSSSNESHDPSFGDSCGTKRSRVDP